LLSEKPLQHYVSQKRWYCFYSQARRLRTRFDGPLSGTQAPHLRSPSIPTHSNTRTHLGTQAPRLRKKEKKESPPYFLLPSPYFLSLLPSSFSLLLPCRRPSPFFGPHNKSSLDRIIHDILRHLHTMLERTNIAVIIFTHPKRPTSSQNCISPMRRIRFPRMNNRRQGTVNIDLKHSVDVVWHHTPVVQTIHLAVMFLHCLDHHIRHALIL